MQIAAILQRKQFRDLEQQVTSRTSINILTTIWFSGPHRLAVSTPWFCLRRVRRLLFEVNTPYGLQNGDICFENDLFHENELAFIFLAFPKEYARFVSQTAGTLVFQPAHMSSESLDVTSTKILDRHK